MNMSYCRYENTLYDLRDCLEDATEHINEEAESPVSSREIGYFRKMVEEMYNFLYENDLINYKTQEIDEEKLDEYCSRMEGGDEV